MVLFDTQLKLFTQNIVLDFKFIGQKQITSDGDHIVNIWMVEVKNNSSQKRRPMSLFSKARKV